ncbi:MAG: hypothetical protein ABL986_22465 [Vicinamibacterales bacterium]
MTSSELAELTVKLIRQVAAARREREVWHLIAMMEIRIASELWRELELIDRRKSTHQRRVAELRRGAMVHRREDVR